MSATIFNENEAREEAVSGILSLRSTKNVDFSTDCNVTMSALAVKEKELTDKKVLIYREKVEKKPPTKSRVNKKPSQVASFPLHPPRGYSLIPNSDVKYTYPLLMSETLMGGDSERITNLMRRIMDVNVVLHFEYDGEQNPYGPNQRIVQGIDSVIAMYIALMKTCPDAVIDVVKNSISAYGDREKPLENSFLRFSVAMTQTKVMTIVGAVAGNKNTCRDIKVGDAYVENSSSSSGSSSSLSTTANQETSQSNIVSNSDNDILHSSSSSQSTGRISPVSNLDTSRATPIIPCTTKQNNTQNIIGTKNNSKHSNSMDSLTLQFDSIKLQPVQGPIISTYHVGKYFFIINSENKIVNLNHLFRVTHERPAFI